MNDSFIAEISDNLVSTLNNSLGIWYVIVLNAFGVMAICCKILEYQSKKRNLAFLLAMVAQTLWVAYFVLNGDFISAISCLLTFLAVLLFSQREKYKWAKSVWWLVAFLVVQGALSVLTFKGWKDIFPALAGFGGVIAYYCVDMRKYRAISFFYSLAWLLNSVLKLYLLAFISDLASVISVSVGIYRYDIRKKKQKQTPLEKELSD